MADLHKMSDKETRAFHQFEAARDQATRRELLKLGAQSRLRVATAIAPGLDPKHRPQLRLLAALSHRIGSAYERLEHMDGAIRYARRLSRLAARRAGLAPRRPA